MFAQSLKYAILYIIQLIISSVSKSSLPNKQTWKIQINTEEEEERKEKGL